ncbi:MAG: hypothetical protein AB1656_02160 [Candidatus Omnitrophota bacterium]
MEKILRNSIGFILAGLFCAAFFAIDAPQSAYAQDEEIIPTGVPPLSKPVSLLDVPLAVYPFIQKGVGIPKFKDQNLIEIKVQFEDLTESRNSLDITEDFLPLTTSALTSGLALFQESGANTGSFSYVNGDPNSDNPIDLSEKPTVEVDPVVPGKFMVTFKPRSGSAYTKLPQYNDAYPDFYVVCRTSLNIRQGDRFEASIPANGIKIKDNLNKLPKDTVYDDRFPGDAFANLAPEFTERAVFEGDIVQIVNVVTEEDNSFRIDAGSDARTILGIDFAGRPDEEYYLDEVRVNWIGLNLAAVGKLLTVLADAGYSGTTFAGMMASGGGITEQAPYYNPSFFYSPNFYNFPEDPETGELLTEKKTLPTGDEIEYPMTMPLDIYGFPIPIFQIGYDNPDNYVLSYVANGPRKPYDIATYPKTVSQNIFQSFQPDSTGGIFLYRENGGTKGKYDAGVDNLIKLDSSNFRIETFDIDPEEMMNINSPMRKVLQRLLPGQYGGEIGKELGPFLFGDDNLAAYLMGVIQLPDPAAEPRPPLGSLECYMDEDCLFFDLMINVLRPYLGLTEGQIRYLFDYTEGNGRINAEELFGYPIVQGFSFVMPVAKNNALSNLKAPDNRTGDNAGGEIYIGIKTSDNLRSLDSFIPFIQPNDVKIGTGVTNFTKGATEGVKKLNSVSSIGFGRKGTGTTYAMIGRPKPRFQFQDLTQPGEGPFASNTNILYDSSMSSPPKAVIGIDVMDFGQNASLTDNHESIAALTLIDTFLTENTVLGEVDVEFLPGPRNLVFNPLILGVVPTQLGVDVRFSRLVSTHNLALYFDDDTATGNGRDDDLDGLTDEELYNMQDDDGDGLIDEDLGDYTPKGINGVFDSNDRPFPLYFDNFGSTRGFVEGTYIFPPNSLEKYTDYVNAIQAGLTNPYTVNTGELMPLSISEGSWFGELDMRAVGYSLWETSRSYLYPPSSLRPFGTAAGPPWDFPDYNQGTIIGSGYLISLEPYTGLMDLLTSMLDGTFPYYPEDLFIEDPESGEQTWMIQLTSTSESNLRIIGDPDGDVRRTFALSFANAFRLINPTKGFVRVGRTPMVINVPATGAQDPQGDSLVNAPFHQFGLEISISDYNAIGDYLSGIRDTLSQAYESAYQAIADYNQAVADAEAAAVPDPETGETPEPEYPDPPDVIEVTVDDPYYALGVNDWVGQNDGLYSTNYMYQIQLPDENTGPLAGNDFYIVLRASDQARVGESFRVRISSGNRSRVYVTTDQTTGTTTNVIAPKGGISYHSFMETDYGAGIGIDPFMDVSKNQITTSEIIVSSQNVPPTIKFTAPGAGVNVASEKFEYELSFLADDSDDVASILLYVDDNSLDFNGTFIPGASLREGFDRTFTLKLREHIADFDPTKKYYVYAKIDDGVNPPIYTYADGYIIASSGGGDGSGGDSGTGGGSVVVRGDLTDTIDYVKLTSDGRLFSLGDAPAMKEIALTTSVIDMEVNSTFSGYILLLTNGEVLGVGDVKAFLTRLQPNYEITFKPDEIAFYKNSVNGGNLIVAPEEGDIAIDHPRDVEVDYLNGGIYILDGDGDMLFLGNANRNFYPPGMDLDIYRDMELSPDGKSIYFLTGNGILSSAGATTESWMNLIPEDKFRDIELIAKGGVVTNVMIVNDDGVLTITGSGDARDALLSLKPAAPIAAGTIRQVKLLPGVSGAYMLVAGSGEVQVLSKSALNLPSDRYIFSDLPGLEDDKVADVETANINLQTVVQSVRNIFGSYADEDVNKIMGYVSPDYKGACGDDAEGLRLSLMTFFSFYEVNSFIESTLAANSFVITNQGEYVNATVIVDFDAYYPQIQYQSPEVDQAATSKTYEAVRMAVVPFTQDVRIRDVGDGRFWSITLWQITNFGRRTDLMAQDTYEFDDMLLLKTLSGNKRLGTYSPRNKSIDSPAYYHLTKNAADSFGVSYLVGEFQELTLNRDYQPPALEALSYNGSFLSSGQFTTLEFKFKQNADGQYKLVSMNMRQIMMENTDLTFGTDTDATDSPLSSIDGMERDVPFGFDLAKRGVVVTVYAGDADITINGQNFEAPNYNGGIMMLPENTDIYTLNPMTEIKKYNRTIMRLAPYDPAVLQGGTTDNAGHVATLTPGRAYLVIAKDGKHFGFVQIPADEAVDDQVISFDYRYESSFILPGGF